MWHLLKRECGTYELERIKSCSIMPLSIGEGVRRTLFYFFIVRFYGHSGIRLRFHNGKSMHFSLSKYSNEKNYAHSWFMLLHIDV